MPRAASDTRMAPARVCFTLGAYFGLARNVSCPGPGLLHARDAGDLHVPIALEAAAQGVGDLAKFHRSRW